MPYHFDQDCAVIGHGGVPYTARIQITQDAWEKADDDVQNEATNILKSEPIQLLSISGKGNGLKRESDGWTIHTQSNKRLYDRTHMEPAPRTFTFDQYRKSPH